MSHENTNPLPDAIEMVKGCCKILYKTHGGMLSLCYCKGWQQMLSPKTSKVLVDLD